MLDNLLENSATSDINSYHPAAQNRVIPVAVNSAKDTVAIHDFPAKSVVEPFWYPVVALDNMIAKSVSSTINSYYNAAWNSVIPVGVTSAKNTVAIRDFRANSVVEPLCRPF